ncbi:MAG: hypothetical protein H7345_10185 [Rubritepida sp.]|nr:hypothetical protein [Rubritepida sp.]
MVRRSTLLMGLALAMLALPAMAQTHNNQGFRLDNPGPRPINETYVSFSADANWGQDRLGVSLAVLPAGQCMNGARVIRADSTNQERRQVNTCNITDLIFH